MLDDILDFMCVVIFPVAVIASLVLGVAFGLGEIYDRYRCGNYAEMTGKKTKSVALDACYIQTGSGCKRWAESNDRAIANDTEYARSDNSPATGSHWTNGGVKLVVVGTGKRGRRYQVHVRWRASGERAKFRLRHFLKTANPA